MFGLGLQELIILGVLGVVLLGGAIYLILGRRGDEG
jgi:hypothetical protein